MEVGTQVQAEEGDFVLLKENQSECARTCGSPRAQFCRELILMLSFLLGFLLLQHIHHCSPFQIIIPD